MSEEEIIKDVVEIVELAKEEIQNNDENITATLDLQDLKSLKGLLDLYKQEKEKNNNLIHEIRIYQNETIAKNKIRDLIKELKKNKIKKLDFQKNYLVIPVLELLLQEEG